MVKIVAKKIHNDLYESSLKEKSLVVIEILSFRQKILLLYISATVASAHCREGDRFESQPDAGT